MLDRGVVQEFIDWESEEREWEIPRDIDKKTLLETFCRYVEDDYYEWLKDNFESFFNHGDPYWEWIRERVKFYSNQ